jgi:signal transduction histidine kinase/CheY-like chemotaxis protein
MSVVDERIVVLAPSAHDGPVTVSILVSAGFDCALVRDVEELCDVMRAGAAVVVVAQEALAREATQRFGDVLAHQEPWSDLPIIVFTGRGQGGTHANVAALAASGNVTLLERPVETITLVSAVRAGLRARRRQYAARRLLAELRDADRRKSEFLAVLSHELRNPLAPIRNSIYLLEHTAPGSGAAAHAKEVMRRQIEHLTRLVDDLLDVTRISVGKIELHRGRVDLRETVRKTTDDLHSMFTGAAVKLRVEYVTVGPVWIDADSTRIAQVLGNLLHNAVKFTPSGGTVSVQVGARDGRAELSVRDDGAGMDPTTIDDMFAPFAQAAQTLARTTGGLGLGLALVKGLVELHGGTVRARSDGIGHGAEFLVTLPLVESVPEARGAQPRETRTVKPRAILLIEDNVDGAQSLAEVLALYGHHVRVARDGRTGIELARELRPDVILCDIGLPDLDGYEVARAVRSEEALRATRLVALSGYVQPEDRQRAREAGFDSHLPKPADLEQLMDVLAKAG